MATTVVHPETQAAAHTGGLRAFYIGAAIDFVLGLELVLFGPAVAALLLTEPTQLFGIEGGTLLRVLGAALIVLAAETFWLARSSTLQRYLKLVVAANWAWVAASAVAVVAGYTALSTFGVVAITAVALVAAELAIFQRRAL